MAFDVRRLRRQRSLFCGILGVSILFGLIWNYSRPRNISSDSSRRTFDVFDPVYGIFPGQRQLSGQSPGRQIFLLVFEYLNYRYLVVFFTMYLYLIMPIMLFKLSKVDLETFVIKIYL